MLNISQNKESFADQKRAKSIGCTPPRGRYHFVNTALQFKEGVSKDNKPYKIFMIYAKALALVKTGQGTENEAKLAVEGNGSRRFEIFWDLQSNKCKRDLSWMLMACGLDPDTESFDAEDKDLLAKTLIGMPYEMAFDAQPSRRNPRYEDVSILEVKKLPREIVKQYTSKPDWDALACLAQDPWNETFVITPRQSKPAPVTHSNDTTISDSEFDEQFGDDW